MTIVSDLPDALTSSLLQSWISVADLSRLDSAVCNTVDRPAYLAVVRSPNFVVRSSCFNEMERPHAFDEDEEREVMRRLRMAYMAWIMKRHICTSTIDVDAVLAHSPHDTGPYLTQHGKYVTEVVCSSTSGLGKCDSLIRDLGGYCPDVRAFTCNPRLEFATKLHTATTWSKLTKLTIHYNGDSFAVFARCWMLTELTILSKYNNCGKPLRGLFQQCAPTLRKISARNICFDEAILRGIAARFPLLEELETTGAVTDAVLFALADGCPGLLSLTLSSCPVTDAGIVAIASNRALVALSLTWCNAVSDAGLRGVAERCTQFARIEIIDMPLVTDATLVALGKYGRSLRSIRLQIKDVAPASVHAIALCSPLLEDLQVRHCPGIGPTVQTVAERCPKLRTLRVTLAQVPATAVLALAKNCPFLEDVQLEGGDIGDAAVVALVSRCQQLYKLDVCETAITPRAVHAMVQRCGRRLKEMEVPGCVDPYSFDPERMRGSRGLMMPTCRIVDVSHLRAWLLNPDPEDAR
jgi:hypothetical protein